ncbi:MAG: hypothetical protein LJE68_11065 [Rhodobacter sp.]|jgi:hypothetical protein|nr:hypothetical protein [Rhodobacter sp.]
MAHDIQIAGLKLSILGYEFPQSQEYCDANWLLVSATLEAPGTRIKHRGTFIRTDELQGFLGEMKELDALRTTSAKLDCMEPDLAVSMQQKGSLGALDVQVSLNLDRSRQAHQVAFECDLSFLPGIISGLERVLDAFPVRTETNV